MKKKKTKSESNFKITIFILIICLLAFDVIALIIYTTSNRNHVDERVSD